MATAQRQFLVDDDGNRTAVVVPLQEWKRLLLALEEYHDIAAFDEAEEDDSEVIRFEEALAEIERGEVD